MSELFDIYRTNTLKPHQYAEGSVHLLMDERLVLLVHDTVGGRGSVGRKLLIRDLIRLVASKGFRLRPGYTCVGKDKRYLVWFVMELHLGQYSVTHLDPCLIRQTRAQMERQ